MPPITTRSLLLPIASVAIGMVFLAINENLLASELLIAAAGLAIITGCSILAVHPFIGDDTQGRKILESILSIVVVFFAKEAIHFFTISEWDSTQVNYMAVILIIVSFLSLTISILGEK